MQTRLFRASRVQVRNCLRAAGVNPAADEFTSDLRDELLRMMETSPERRSSVLEIMDEELS